MIIDITYPGTHWKEWVAPEALHRSSYYRMLSYNIPVWPKLLLEGDAQSIFIWHPEKNCLQLCLIFLLGGLETNSMAIHYLTANYIV